MGKKILIVGGVAGGASCAARMRRLDESAEIVMFEKGEYISFANCGLPYYIGDTIKERENLIVQTPQKFKDRFNVDVRTNAEVISINPAEKTISAEMGSRHIMNITMLWFFLRELRRFGLLYAASILRLFLRSEISPTPTVFARTSIPSKPAGRL